MAQIGLGGAWLGPPSSAPEEAAAVVRAALDAGVAYVDTAPLYTRGESERIVGAVLGERPRHEFRLSTKVGRRIELGADGPQVVFDYSRSGIRRSLAESLWRLGLPSVDVLYLHDPVNAQSSAEAVEAYRELERLRDEGIAAEIGVGVNRQEYAEIFLRQCSVDVVLLAGRLTLLDQSAAGEFLPACEAAGVRVVIGGVYNSGVLADPDLPGVRYDYKPAPTAIVARVRRIAQVCARHDVPLKAAAVQFPFGAPAVDAVLVSASRPAELAENLEMARWPIPDSLWAELRREGLVS